jgi:DNA-binding SARP family transcriptional activator
MTAGVIRLLGRPEIERGGRPAPAPRGRKAWALLACLALSARAPTRERLAGLLFADAADPLGALRWNLAELRRGLGLPDALRGDPPGLDLPVGWLVDAVALAGDRPDPDLVRGELLEGADPVDDTGWGAWLLIERRRLAGICEGVLRDAALAALGAGRSHDAAELAGRALALAPFDESLHELLVRCLCATGDIRAARDRAEACEALFRRELGRSPDPRVRRAAEPDTDERPAAPGDRSAALGQLAAGVAALDAGAVDPGVACLRLAVGEARALGDHELLARALTALGSALVHAVRGRDEEGAALLHEALAMADETKDRATALEACRELGYVDVQAGRGAAAGRWLHRATALVESDAERAAVLGIRGMALSDRAHYAAAIQLLTESVCAAERSGSLRPAAWSLAILGRVHLLRDDLTDAAAALDRSLAIIEVEGWVALRPLPEALRAEVMLRRGDPAAAAALLDRAFALGCRLGDPCWEAFAARARGIVQQAQGDPEGALRWLRDAAQRAVRVPDPYAWVRAHCLDTLARVAGAEDGGSPEALAAIDELERIAARGDMRELVVRAALHRARLGDRAGLVSARLLCEGIDNPVLQAEVAAAA